MFGLTLFMIRTIIHWGFYALTAVAVLHAAEHRFLEIKHPLLKTACDYVPVIANQIHSQAMNYAPTVGQTTLALYDKIKNPKIAYPELEKLEAAISAEYVYKQYLAAQKQDKQSPGIVKF
ncbi:hypothetical protein JNK13_08685 [bacterium]|nr:hypothetical protein [bacterium]